MRRLALCAVLAAACAGPSAAGSPAGPGASPSGAAAPAQARPPDMKLTHALDAWVGREILVALAGGQPEAWFLREIAGDHITLERSRTFRLVPVRRVAEIGWTDLAGADPRPLLVLAPD